MYVGSANISETGNCKYDKEHCQQVVLFFLVPTKYYDILNVSHIITVPLKMEIGL